jgi:response regulator RpfG family c-di-GMP phosphodiesterase
MHSATFETHLKLEKMRTLILIDNNNDDLQFMREAISSVDPHIQSLSFIYADEAVDALQRDLVVKPDTIFININMPAKSGLKCFLELRRNNIFNDVPIIVYAPRITSEIVESLKDSGAIMTFEKPNTIRGWKETMNGILNSVPVAPSDNLIDIYDPSVILQVNK